MHWGKGKCLSTVFNNSEELYDDTKDSHSNENYRQNPELNTKVLHQTSLSIGTQLLASVSKNCCDSGGAATKIIFF